MFANAKEIVDYINAHLGTKAYVAGFNANEVVMEFYYIGGKTLILPAFQSDGITAVTIPADVKFITPKCQVVNVIQSGNAVV